MSKEPDDKTLEPFAPKPGESVEPFAPKPGESVGRFRIGEPLGA